MTARRTDSGSTACLRTVRRGDAGAATVEFVMVLPLLILLVLAVAQLTLALHVRTTLTAAAAEGARTAALADRGPADGVRRARQVLDGSLSADVIEAVTARSVTIDGVRTIEIEIHARLPLVGLLGPATLVVRGHALEEAP